MASRMTGIREFRSALKDAPDALRDRIYRAIKTSVDGVHARGLGNLASMVQRRTGTLARNYRRVANRQGLSGRVGYLSDKARTEAFYARFINDGTSRISARPFHTAAVEAEEDADTRRMVEARDDVLGILAAGRRIG